MPAGILKNMAYGLALPLLGKRCAWKAETQLERVLKKHHTVGAAVQFFDEGKLTALHTAGYACLQGTGKTVAADTMFRTASIAKMVTALLVLRLQTLGRLSVEEDVSDFLGYAVRNPHHPQQKITLGMLMSHTSSIVDSPAYFAAFHQMKDLEELLEDPQAFSASVPGMQFRYSNLAAGMIACLLEARFGVSFEMLAQNELFVPLGVRATFDMTALERGTVADSWRVLPQGLGFDANARMDAAKPVSMLDAKHHYLLASGGLYISAEALARLALVAWNGRNGFLDEKSLRCLQTPILGWPDQRVSMKHGMGLFKMDDPKICTQPLWGHQGFAYGAVNGVFFDASGSGFVCLNSGASEQRTGHLACLNRDLIAFWMKEKNK